MRYLGGHRPGNAPAQGVRRRRGDPSPRWRTRPSGARRSWTRSRSPGSCSGAPPGGVEAGASGWLRLWGLPTRRDVVRLANQVGEPAARGARAAPRGRVALMAPGLLGRQARRWRNGLAHARGLDEPVVAQTPRDLVWRRDDGAAVALPQRGPQRRRAAADRAQPRQSRSYILDLLPENSMVALPRRRGLRRLPARLGARPTRPTPRTRSRPTSRHADPGRDRGDRGGARSRSWATASPACSRCSPRPRGPSCRSATSSRFTTPCDFRPDGVPVRHVPRRAGWRPTT